MEKLTTGIVVYFRQYLKIKELEELFIRYTARAFRKLLSIMYLVISLLVLKAGYGILLYHFLIIAYLFYFSRISDTTDWLAV